MIKQVTAFLPNKPGVLMQMSMVLGDAGIQILGLMVADSSDFSAVRFTCDYPVRACKSLQEAGIQAAVTEVLAIAVPDVPGGLSTILARLVSADLNIGYAYCCTIGGRVVDIINVSSEPVEVKLAEIGFLGMSAEELGIHE